MTVNSATVAPPATTAPASSTGADMAQLSGNFSTFLTLLTTQLKNQDPTSPMDSNQFTQQLVMYSQVEQQIDTNTNLKSLISQGQSNAGQLAANYLGKRVSVTSGSASLANGQANWTYNLSSAASSAALSITDASGRTVYTGAGPTNAGANSVSWDGNDNNGNPLPDGSYKLTVTATDAAGNAVAAPVASSGTVSQIDMTGGTPRLVIGNMEIGLGDVAAVAN